MRSFKMADKILQNLAALEELRFAAWQPAISMFAWYKQSFAGSLSFNWGACLQMKNTDMAWHLLV